MQFINIVVHSVEDMNFRVHLQYEFTKLGLDEYLDVSMSGVSAAPQRGAAPRTQLGPRHSPPLCCCPPWTPSAQSFWGGGAGCPVVPLELQSRGAGCGRGLEPPLHKEDQLPLAAITARELNL